MAKTSKKRTKSQVGCMWGLVNLFTFRRSQATKKLITNKDTRGTEHRRKILVVRSDVTPKENLNLDKSLEEVKSEVNNVDEQCSKQDNIAEEQLKNVVEVEGKWKNSRRTIRGRWRSCDFCVENTNVAANSKPDDFLLHAIQRMPSKSLDFGEGIRSLRRLSNVDSKSEQIPEDEFREFVNMKHLLVDDKLNSNAKFSTNRMLRSRRNTLERTEELEVTRSAEEMVPMYSQCPRIPCDINMEESISLDYHEDLIIDKMSKHPASPILGSPSSEEIVVLKPEASATPKHGADAKFYSSPEAHSVVRNKVSLERHVSYRLFTQLTRKLRKKSPSNYHFFMKGIFRHRGSKKVDTFKPIHEAEDSVVYKVEEYRKQKLNNIYVEAKKHLSEFMGNEDEGESVSREQNPSNSLGTILSFTEDISCSRHESDKKSTNSFLLPKNPPKKSDRDFIQQTATSHSDDLQSEVSTDNGNIEEKAQSPSNPVLEDPGGLYGRENCSRKTSSCSIRDIKSEETEIEDSEEDVTTSEPSITDSQSREIADAFESHRTDFLDSFLCRTPEEPSPVSVLEIAFLEDDSSPSGSNSSPEELKLQPVRLVFRETVPLEAEDDNNESVSAFVMSALQSAAIDWEDFYLRPYCLEQLLDPSIANKGFFSDVRYCERKVLLDCANEVLLEICNRNVYRLPGLSVMKPWIQPIPDKKAVLPEALNMIHWLLRPVPPPRTLEQLVQKDLSKSGTWMDLQEDSNSSIVEVSEMIFDDLVEDAAATILLDQSIADIVGIETVNSPCKCIVYE